MIIRAIMSSSGIPSGPMLCSLTSGDSNGAILSLVIKECQISALGSSGPAVSIWNYKDVGIIRNEERSAVRSWRCPESWCWITPEIVDEDQPIVGELRTRCCPARWTGCRSIRRAHIRAFAPVPEQSRPCTPLSWAEDPQLRVSSEPILAGP